MLCCEKALLYTFPWLLVPLSLTPCPSCNAARRWYATQALPLVFIGGLVVFLAVDAGRVRQFVGGAMCSCHHRVWK